MGHVATWPLGMAAHWILGSPMGRSLCTQVVTGSSQCSETPLELKSLSFPRPESQLLGDAVWF